MALWMRWAGRGMEGPEDVEEDEDEEEMVVFGDGGCAGRMEGISSGSGREAGGWRGPAATQRPAGPI